MLGKAKNRKSLTELLMTSDGAISIMVVLLGFLCGTILILAVGRNPVGMYKALLQVLTGFNVDRGRFYVRYVGEWLAQSMPFILCGLSMAFAGRPRARSCSLQRSEGSSSAGTRLTGRSHSHESASSDRPDAASNFPSESTACGFPGSSSSARR